MKVDIKAKNIGTNINAEVVHIGGQDGSSNQVEQSVRVLFVGVNPITTTHLRLDEEIRSIDEAIQRTRFRSRLELRSQWAVRATAELQSHLLRHDPDIVHFAGHGGTTGELLLEDATGRAQPVPRAELQGLFTQLAGRVRCVVLNACFSKPQAEALAEKLPCVVGMSRAIEDSAAIRFATAFYEAIGHGRDVKTAFELGRLQVRSSHPFAEPSRNAHALGPSAAAADDLPVLLGCADPAQVRFF